MKMKYLHKCFALALSTALLATGTPSAIWAAEEQAVVVSEEAESVLSSKPQEDIPEPHGSDSDSEADSDPIVNDSSEETEYASDESKDQQSDLKQSEKAEECTDSLVEEDKPLEIVDKYNDETAFSIYLNHYKMPEDGKQLMAAVWSMENGQDDLKWYPMDLTGDRYIANVDIHNHKTVGTYQVHVYLRTKTSQMICLEKGTFDVSPVTAGNLEIVPDGKDPSKAKLIVHDVTCPSGVKSIQIPVWSKSDQKDIFWYSAVKTDTNTWTADLKISNHTGAVSGDFHVHVYGTNGIGARKFINNTIVHLEKAMPVVSAEAISTGLKLTVNNCSVASPKSVQFAVWSEAGGQDDLRWYITTTGANGKYTVNMPYPSEAGKFFIHCYAKNADGKLIFQNSTTYFIEHPTANTIKATVPELTDGTFSLVISDLTFPEQIKEITVPVWSASDQSDIYWYKAAKTDDGNWIVKGSIANHKNHTGIYHAHAYVTTFTGVRSFACSTSLQMKAPETSVTAKFSSDFKTLQMSASYIVLNEAIKDVRYAVWTAQNKQDDLRWYTVTSNNGIYNASVPVSNHPGNGPFYVHVYAFTQSGKMVFVKSMELPYDLNVKADIRVGEFSQEKFTSDLFVDLSDFSIDVKKVEIATWSKGDQSDIYWYQAARSGGDSWYAAFSPLRHKGNTGTFQLHVYVTFVNGVRVFAGRTTSTVTASNSTYLKENADGTVTAILYSNQPLKNMSVAVWSQQNGQDDLKWYPLTNSGSCYSAVLSIRNHKHNGLYYAHFYGNGVCLGNETFSFPETIGSTESIYRVDHMGHSDVKFMNGKLAARQNGQLVLLNLNGTMFKCFPEIHAYWLYCLESENLIVYCNEAKQVGLLKLDSSFNIMWNITVAEMANTVIDPAIAKTSDGYMITATEITGNVNNADPSLENGIYTICSWDSSDLVNWNRRENLITADQNLEDVDLYEKDGVLYLVYEQEIRDKGNSSIMCKTSSDQGYTWSKPIELLPADCDHEPAVFSSNGDRFILFYSADKDLPGTSYMGAKAYYAVYDKNLNCISRDNEVKTGSKGGVLWYDVTWIDSTHYILYAENYLTTGTLVVEKSR
ncbi:MAG: GBS Bsp-like repeat-containing protein [Lachnospiraceae bacterium]|nr:GBS Bsp-like repeat-containing protein [Lachnospiraceae bacterium]